MKEISAAYITAILPEHRGNPLIEGLPPKLSDEMLIARLSYYPTCSKEEKKLDAFERVEYLSRLKELRQPLPAYIDCFRAIERAIKEGYSSKNPLSPTTMNYLHYLIEKRPEIEPHTGFFQPKGSGLTVMGESGVGKTSMLEQILSCFPDTIGHTSYQGKLLPLKQVVWVKVDCPDDSSVRALCHKILSELDKKLGLPPTKPAGTIPMLLDQIEARIKSSFLGILVIDEMQNLNLAKTGGSDRLLSFIHNLVNNLGIPILFCANPPFNILLSKTLKAARRAESSGYFDISLMKNDEEWILFVQELWALQWTNAETELTQNLSDKLYDLSVGNMDLAVRIYREAQRIVIGTQDETISETLLELASNNALKATKDVVREIKRERLSMFMRAQKPVQNLPTKAQVTLSEKQDTVIVESKKIVTIPGDLNRTYHPEFSQAIFTLQHAKDMHEMINDPDLFQRASEDENPLDILSGAGIFCEDPLTAFKGA